MAPDGSKFKVTKGAPHVLLRLLDPKRAGTAAVAAAVEEEARERPQ